MEVDYEVIGAPRGRLTRWARALGAAGSGRSRTQQRRTDQQRHGNQQQTFARHKCFPLPMAVFVHSTAGKLDAWMCWTVPPPVRRLAFSERRVFDERNMVWTGHRRLG